MQSVVLVALLLVAGVSAEQPQEVSNVQTGPAQNQPSHVAVESGPQTGAHQPHFASGQVVSFEQPAVPHYYSPAGVMQVVGQQGGPAATGEPQSAKPVPHTVRHYAAPAGPEQYGQPESASIPPNYKPFGSWGLYIGGNPADGYYTNYYKALSNSVADKQQAGEQTKPTGSQSFVSQASGFGPPSGSSFYKQGPAYPPSASFQPDAGYPYGEYYTPADLNSGSRVQVQGQGPSTYSAGFGPEFQPAPAPATYYGAESYAASKKGGSQQSGFSQKEVQTPLSPAKGYAQQQQQRYGYAYASQSGYQSPVTVHQASSFQQPQPQQPQVVAYPVPVGSQLVGSQPGVEGAFQPYGVHGFTRYAVKPTVVGAEQNYYHTGVHSAPASQFPVYRQQFGYQQPMSFYGYPLSQLHYSNGAVAPSFGTQVAPAGPPAQAAGAPGSPAGTTFQAVGVQQPGAPQGVVEHVAPVAHGPVEAAGSEKSETNSEAEKQQVKPQQQ